MRNYLDILEYAYREESTSTFTHDGVEYNLNCVLSAAADIPSQMTPVSQLVWLLDEAGYYDSNRLNTADLDAPLLLVKWNNRMVVLDGLHRLSKAAQMGVPLIRTVTIPERFLLGCSTILKENEDEDEDYAPYLPSAQILPVGTTLYHGTSEVFDDHDLEAPCWVSNDIETAEYFTTWHEGSGKPRIAEYNTTEPLKLAVLDRNSFDALEDDYGIGYAGVDDAPDFLNLLRRLGFDGWIIPDNYGPGKADILLGSTDALAYGKTTLTENEDLRSAAHFEIGRRPWVFSRDPAKWAGQDDKLYEPATPDAAEERIQFYLDLFKTGRTVAYRVMWLAPQHVQSLKAGDHLGLCWASKMEDLYTCNLTGFNTDVSTKPIYIFEAEIPQSSVDWRATIQQNFDLPWEHEIVLKHSAPLTLRTIRDTGHPYITYVNSHDGEPIRPELTGVIFKG